MTAPSDQPVGFSPSGPPETVLEPPPPEARTALDEAMARPEAERLTAVGSVAARFPRWAEAWAALGNLATGVEAYAYYRVGYHRGLDALRASGWRGTGYVRWRHESNRGFLRALDGLRRTAGEIGESDEEARCQEFLHQLDPDWDAREA
ncbi:MAG: DUF3151 family protein [Actinobacteria bacterium]|nr:DUF3151 family protein [Actinomycetota bacterium]